MRGASGSEASRPARAAQMRRSRKPLRVVKARRGLESLPSASQRHDASDVNPPTIAPYARCARIVAAGVCLP
jgi:hypothetical protein